MRHVCTKKKNRSGSAALVVVDKYGGKFKELHTVGVATDESEIARLCNEGRKWIYGHLGMLELDFEELDNKAREEELAREVLNNIDSVLLNGAKLLMDKVYNMSEQMSIKPLFDYFGVKVTQ